jgi:hypothetical protein
MNKNKSTTQNYQQKPHLKFAYLDLPGHPFYGQKVQIIQEGRTDTMAWCLIAHPTQEGLHYRISKRWLCQKAPDKHLKHCQPPCQNPIPIEALEKLAIFLKTLSRNDDRDRKGKGETKEEKKGKAHLGKFTDTEEARSGRKAPFFAIMSGRECQNECDIQNSGKPSSEESCHIYPAVFCPANGE